MEEKKNIHEYKKIETREDYINLFLNKDEALKQVLDIRKFEIELYWKRTAFFWTILTAIIAGYFLIYSKLTAIPDNNSLKILFSLGCLGLIFSIGWYFVNRGSKFWQVNWEKHLDCIEDEVMGPLYKTTIDTNYYHGKFFSLISPYPFSVSKINQILNLVLIVFWIAMLFDFSFTYLTFKPFSIDNYLSFYLWAGLLTLFAIFSLFTFTHTGLDNYFKNKSQRNETTANFEKRGVK